MADESVQVRFGAETKEAEAGVEHVGVKLKELDGPLREIAEAFGLLRRTFIEAFAVDEIVEFVSHMAELGEQAIRTSEMLGIGIEKVQELNFAARMVGGGADGASQSLTRLERNMAEAQSGTGKVYEAFQNLGVTLDDLKTKSPDQILGMIADKFAGAEDGATKTAYAMDLMGRAGAQMIPLLNQGSEGLERMGVIAQQTGSVLSGPQAEGLEKTSQNMVTLKASAEGVGLSLLEVFHPAIDAAIQGLTQLVQWVNYVVQGFRLLTLFIEDEIVLSIAKLIEIFEEMGVKGSQYVEEIKIAFQTLGQIIDDVVHLHFDQAVKDWENGSQRIVEAQKKAAAEIANLGKEYEDFKTRVMDATAALFAFGETGEKANKTALPPAPTTAAAQTDNSESVEMQIEKSNLTTEEQLAKIALQQKKDILDQEVSDHAISKQQELAQEMDFVRQNEQIELDAVNKYADLYDKDTAQYAEAQNKKRVITAQANEQIQKLTAQSASEQKKEYDSFFQTVNGAFSQMVTGILQGTQTWQQALGRVFDNLTAKFIDDVVLKMVERWAAMEAQKLGISQAFEQLMVALGIESAAEAAAGQTAASAAANTAKITSDGAVVFAGVFANLAPLLGPAAAGPAAASEAAVLAQIPQASLAVGAWDLGSDMVAQLHAGEMVVPRTFAEGIRDGNGLGGGGDNYNVNISLSAIDTQTGAQFLKNNSNLIAQAISAQMRNGNASLRTAMKG